MGGSFDASKQYQTQEEVFFDDGREIELLHFVYGKPDIEALRGKPHKVLAAIDEFARSKKYLMNVGEDKGAIVTKAIQESKPQVMVELGGYVGYSSILFGSTFREAGGQRYWTLERNPEFGAITASLVNLAGLSDTVQVIVGSSSASIRRLHASGQLQRVDMMFLDHYKPAYTPDLKLCEDLKLIHPGTVLAADNVIKPGNPPYLEYVRSTTSQKQESQRSTAFDASFAKPTVNQYASRQGGEVLDETCAGNPNLIYESTLIHSFEPTGVPDGIEITRCIGEEK